MDHTEMTLAARFDATQLAEHLYAARLMRENETATRFYMELAHKDFAGVAKRLGYRIERIQPEEAAA